jgi:Flp pilus assembly pilin Flp
MRPHLRRRQRKKDEQGTTTAEYAIGTLAACAFAAVLYKILTGGSVAAALGGLVHRALGLTG